MKQKSEHNPKVLVTEECSNIIALLRGGMPLSGAATAVGLTYPQAYNQLKKTGMSAKSLKAVGPPLRDGNVEPVLTALDLYLGGAVPEVVFNLTGVSLSLLDLRIGELSEYGYFDANQYKNNEILNGDHI